MKKLLQCLCVVSVTLFATQPGHAQTLTQITFGDWLLVCNQPETGSDETCVLSHAVSAPPDNVKLLGITITFDKVTRTFPTQISVPLGATLATGLTLEVEGAGRLRFAFSRCDAQGCYVEQRFARDVIEGFATGMKVSFADRLGQPLAISVSQQDVSSGVDEMESRALTWIDYLSDFRDWLRSLSEEPDEAAADGEADVTDAQEPSESLPESIIDDGEVHP